MEDGKNRNNSFEPMIEARIFRPCTVKFVMFILIGIAMNMIDNEAVCYGIVLVGVIVFLGKIAMENDANEY